MASTTRGSIKISTANGIGAALVDVLGGEGYKPDEWEQNINLCGIHAADIESALENIEEDAGTGTERGSILLSTANAIGAVLNKKFNTSRGFSPREWASAASKLEPLPERTASGAIANITDGADGVPLKNWLVTLPASLDGYTAIHGTKSGKNLIDLSSLVDGYVNSNGTFNTNHPNGEKRSDFIPVLPNTVYYFSIVETTGTAEAWVGVGEYTSTNTSSFVKRNGYWRFTTSATTKYIVVSARNLAQATKIQLEIGNDSTTWEAYTPIEQYTASLGRTVYGGQADIVSGEGEDENGNAFTFTPITPTPETALGVNNFWSDEGDSDVTYRADISLALQALGGGGRGLMMMRPTEPEETEETEDTEGLEDELNR